ncbi:MAG: cytochrome P450, partial [Mycobacterium sp.]|nr:cytochrome P450 [Mycobacterium sp.]
GGGIAAGVIRRRPRVMHLLERVGADATALSCIRSLRREFGSGPVELRLPGRTVVLVLDAQDVGRVLAGSPDPFTPANREKYAALAPFQPHGVLISRGAARAARRTVNEAALDTGRRTHRFADTMDRAIAEEAEHLVVTAIASGVMSADDIVETWWRVVRRITFGDSARDDSRTTDMLRRLRSVGNWSYFGVPRPLLRERFLDRLYDLAAHPAPGTLVAALDEAPGPAAADPVGQIPHWLFAFDAAGIALTRALALIAGHPVVDRRLVDADPVERSQLLRDSVLESLRLWPTTPTILRDAVVDTTLGNSPPVRVRCGDAVLVQAAVFHRDPDLGDYADRFDPDIWSDGRAEARPDLVPFSAGPARCPGENLVLHTTSTFIGHLLASAQFSVTSPVRPHDGAPLPPTLDNFGLRFAVEARLRQ